MKQRNYEKKLCSSPLKSCLLGLDSGEKLIALVPPLLSKNDQCKCFCEHFFSSYSHLVSTRGSDPMFPWLRVNIDHPELICNCFLHFHQLCSPWTTHFLPAQLLASCRREHWVVTLMRRNMMTIRDAILSKKCSFFEHCSKGLWPPPPFYLNICPILRGVFFNNVETNMKYL